MKHGQGAAAAASDDDDVFAFCERHSQKPTPLGYFGKALGAICDAVREVRQQIADGDARINTRCLLYDSRLGALESKTTTRGLTWAGEHSIGRSYAAGEFCKRAGSVWLAVKDNTSTPGLAPADWELVVKAQAQK